LNTDITKLVPEEEQINPDKAKNLTSYLNNIGIAVSLWVMIYPHPYQVALTIALLYPLVTLYVFYRYRKTISLEDDDNKTITKQPSLITALTLPSFGLVLRAFIDYDLLVFTDSLLTWGIIVLVLTMVMVWIVSISSHKIGLFSKDSFAVILFVLSYSYGSFIMVNCLYDNSKADVYHTRVLYKHVSSGRHTTYYLTLDTWGQRTSPEDVSVPSSIYRATQAGETIDVYVKKGTLYSPWYFVDK
jgi:hypothetical protein